MIYKIDYFWGKLFNNLHLWGGSFLDHIMECISYIAEAGILFLLIGFGLALFKRTRKIGLCILGAVAIGFVFTNIVLKNVISRPRPFSDVGSSFYKWWLVVGTHQESGYSFPSGHTTATTAFAIAIFLTTNKKRFWWILFLPVLMACSRIYLMVHYFSDCVGGLIVGTISATISYFIVKWIYSSKFKLFVWAREINVFKPTEKPHRVKPAKKVPEKKLSKEEFVYVTQEDESRAQEQQKTNVSTQEEPDNLQLNDAPPSDTSSDDKK